MNVLKILHLQSCSPESMLTGLETQSDMTDFILLYLQLKTVLTRINVIKHYK